MIAIPPPTVPVPATQGAGGGPAVPVIDPPPALTALPAGSVVQATVLDRDASGVLLVRSDQGVFSFGSPLTLRPGATLELTVQGSPGQTQVVASVVDRGPPPAPTAPSVPAPPLTPGSIVEAVLVQPAPAAPPPPSGSAAPAGAAAAVGGTPTPASPVSSPTTSTAVAPPAVAPAASAPPAAAAPATAPPLPTVGVPAPSVAAAAAFPPPAAPAAPAVPAAPAASTPPPATAPVSNPGTAAAATASAPPAAPAPTTAVAPPVAASTAPTASTGTPAANPGAAAPASVPAAPVPSAPTPTAAAVPPGAASGPAAAPSSPTSSGTAPAASAPPSPPAPAIPSGTAPAASAPPAPVTTPSPPVATAPSGVSPAATASATTNATGAPPATPGPSSPPAAGPSAPAPGPALPPAPASGPAAPPPTTLPANPGPAAPPATLPTVPSLTGSSQAPTAGPAPAPAPLPLSGAPLLPGSQAASATLAAIIEQQLATVIARNPGGSAAAPATPVPTAAPPTVPATTTGATAVTLAAAAGAGASALSSSPLAGLPAGSELLLRVLSVQPAAAGEALAPTAPATVGTGVVANTVPAAATAVAAASAATASAAAVTAPPAGGAVAASLASVATPTAAAPQSPAAAATAATTAAAAVPPAAAASSPGTPAAAIAAPPLTGTITATVIATSSRGEPILLTGQEVLTLRGASVAPGSTVELALAGLRPSATLADPAAASRSPLPSLPELVAAAQTAGGAAHAALAAVVPQPGPALAGQLLFFLSALQLGGDLRSWIGEPARTALDRGNRSGPLARLDRELKESAESSARSAGGSEWRAFTMPLSDNGAIQPVRLYVHRREDEGGDAEGDDAGKGRSTRFLVDLDLSRLGRIQLDGFAQPPRFDLIMRSDVPLPGSVRTELQGLFASVTSARGLTGSIGFQVAPPITPATIQAAPVRAGILV